MTPDVDPIGRPPLAAAVTVLLVVSAVAAGVSLTAVGTANAAPTGIDSCTTIDEAGAYRLTENVTRSGYVDAGCIRITASDVVFDGNGHTIGDGPAVVVNDSDTLTNVTVRNVVIDTPATAFRATGVSNSTLSNITVPTAGAFTLVDTSTLSGDDNTVVGLTGDLEFDLIGDDNRVLDSEIYGAESGGLLVSGDRNVVRNVSVMGWRPIEVAGTENRIRNSRFDAFYNQPSVTVENATGTVLANVTATGGLSVFENATNATVRDSTLETEKGWGLIVRRSEGVVVANNVATGSAGVGLWLSGSDDNTVRNNTLTGGPVGVDLSGSDDNTLRENRIVGSIEMGDGSSSNLIYDNRINGSEWYATLFVDDGIRSNAWNVSARPGENVVGGNTVGGNYYANDDGTGFSETCEDANDDGICDSPNELAANNTDYLPLADPPNGTDAPDDGDDEPNATTYQVDFAAGQPIENLSADRLYAKQDRLFRFAFGNSTAGITDRGSAWADESLRECVEYGHIVSHDDADTAHVHFTVAENCSDVTLSLAVYSMPGETFDVDTADQQELLNATTGTYGPGEHTIAVDLPDENGNGDDGNATD